MDITWTHNPYTLHSHHACTSIHVKKILQGTLPSMHGKRCVLLAGQPQAHSQYITSFYLHVYMHFVFFWFATNSHNHNFIEGHRARDNFGINCKTCYFMFLNSAWSRYNNKKYNTITLELNKLYFFHVEIQ